MESAVYPKMVGYEESHWLFRGKYDIVRALLTQRFPPSSGARILDVGCATGFFAKSLLDAGYRVTAADTSRQALGYCRERGLVDAVEADLSHLPFPDASFDVLLALDVIEHIRDDVAAVREIARVLAPGGASLLLPFRHIHRFFPRRIVWFSTSGVIPADRLTKHFPRD